MFERWDKYSKNVNSHDFLKFIALLTMFIDHIGYSLTPDEHNILRLIGRTSMPIFLFLVGYANNYKFKQVVLWWALPVLATKILTGHEIFPLNILFSIIIGRFILDYIETKKYGADQIFFTALSLAIWIPVTILAVDYGATAILIIFSGWIVKNHKHTIEGKITFALIFLLHFTIQYHSFDRFELWQQITLFGIFSGLAVILYNYKIRDFSQYINHKFIKIPLLIIARNSLQFYTIHFSFFIFIKMM